MARLVAILFLLWALVGCTKGTADSESKNPAAEAAAAEPARPVTYKTIDFKFLGDFTYVPGDENNDPIPEKILALDGEPVEIEGFMIPLEFADGKTDHFVLLNAPPSCCFGDATRMNQWIDVKMAEGKKAKHFGLTPVVVHGRMIVGEEKDEKGTVVSIYRMTGEKVMIGEQF